MKETVIVGGARTPFGKFGGGLKDVSAADLGATAIRGALNRSGIPDEAVQEVIMGMVLQGGAGQIPSRQALRKAGLPWEVETETINKVCASGMRSVTLADQVIRSNDADVIVAPVGWKVCPMPRTFCPAGAGVSEWVTGKWLI